jgi:hypothetical protein
VTWARTAIAVALLAAACGSGGGGAGGGEGDEDEAARQTTTTVSTTAAPVDNPTCDLLAQDAVSDLFGEEAQVVPADGAGSCLWQAETGGRSEPVLYQLQLSVYEGGGPFDPAAWGGEPEPLAGIGDEGFLVREGGTLGTTAAYRDAARSVVLSYGILLSPDAPDPGAQADQVVDLLRTVHDRLG